MRGEKSSDSAHLKRHKPPLPLPLVALLNSSLSTLTSPSTSSYTYTVAWQGGAAGGRMLVYFMLHCGSPGPPPDTQLAGGGNRWRCVLPHLAGSGCELLAHRHTTHAHPSMHRELPPPSLLPPLRRAHLGAIDVHEHKAGHGLLRDGGVGARRRPRVDHKPVAVLVRLRARKPAELVASRGELSGHGGLRCPTPTPTPPPPTLNSWVCPVTRMSVLSFRCRMASASESPHGTTWWPWQTPIRKSPTVTTWLFGSENKKGRDRGAAAAIAPGLGRHVGPGSAALFHMLQRRPMPCHARCSVAHKLHYTAASVKHPAQARPRLGAWPPLLPGPPLCPATWCSHQSPLV